MENKFYFDMLIGEVMMAKDFLEKDGILDFYFNDIQASIFHGCKYLVFLKNGTYFRIGAGTNILPDFTPNDIIYVCKKRAINGILFDLTNDNLLWYFDSISGNMTEKDGFNKYYGFEMFNKFNIDMENEFYTNYER